jgi:hypothetical protein
VLLEELGRGFTVVGDDLGVEYDGDIELPRQSERRRVNAA